MPRPPSSLQSHRITPLLENPSEIAVFVYHQHDQHYYPLPPPHLGPPNTNDAVHITVGVVEEGHGDSMFAGGNPVPLGCRVDLENMGPGAEDWLLPGGGSTGKMMRY